MDAPAPQQQQLGTMGSMGLQPEPPAGQAALTDSASPACRSPGGPQPGPGPPQQRAPSGTAALDDADTDTADEEELLDDDGTGLGLGKLGDSGSLSYKTKPRRKATQKPVGADQKRQAFSKRKRGIVLKAYQLFKLTDAKVFMFVVNDKGSSWAYSSPSFGAALQPGQLRRLRELAGVSAASRHNTEVMPHPRMDEADRLADDRHLYLYTDVPDQGGAPSGSLAQAPAGGGMAGLATAAAAADASTHGRASVAALLMRGVPVGREAEQRKRGRAAERSPQEVAEAGPGTRARMGERGNSGGGGGSGGGGPPAARSGFAGGRLTGDPPSAFELAIEHNEAASNLTHFRLQTLAEAAEDHMHDAGLAGLPEAIIRPAPSMKDELPGARGPDQPGANMGLVPGSGSASSEQHALAFIAAQPQVGMTGVAGQIITDAAGNMYRIVQEEVVSQGGQGSQPATDGAEAGGGQGALSAAAALLASFGSGATPQQQHIVLPMLPAGLRAQTRGSLRTASSGSGGGAAEGYGNRRPSGDAMLDTQQLPNGRLLAMPGAYFISDGGLARADGSGAPNPLSPGVAGGGRMYTLSAAHHGGGGGSGDTQPFSKHAQQHIMTLPHVMGNPHHNPGGALLATAEPGGLPTLYATTADLRGLGGFSPHAGQLMVLPSDWAQGSAGPGGPSITWPASGTT